VILARSLDELPPPGASGSVVSVGVFDGVHLGHRAILARNRERARQIGACASVVTFHDHPKRLLLGRAPRTLTSLEHRLELFRREGIEQCLVLAFDEALRSVDAAHFADEILKARLGARAFVLGFDSKFGRNREGTPEYLQSLGYPVEVVPQVLVRGRAVSSTAIREAVELGDLAAAAALLGRPYSLWGEVVHGDALGRQLGFPTANLDPHHELLPPTGVYSAWAQVRGRPQPAVVNIGYRPTVRSEQPPTPRIEAHLIGFSGDLYGQTLELEFVQRLREEQRFASLAELRAQIGRDVESARGSLQVRTLEAR
jgi:riboflavin kinase/FMN adenylyltransferase